MKIKINGHIDYFKSKYSGKEEYALHSFDMSEYGWVVVMPYVLEVEVPDDFDPRPDLIAGLKAQQQKARADFEKLCTDIQRQISELQALEFKA